MNDDKSQKIDGFANRALGENNYDDSNERAALKRFLTEDEDFRKYIRKIFKLSTGKKYDLVQDPRGLYNVDLGLRNKAGWDVGLIEVDVYHDWDPDWPKNYKYFHVLERKRKYFEGTNVPYLHCTFNFQRIKMICCTADIIVRYPVVDMPFKKHDMIDRLSRIPLHLCHKFGPWTEEELKRVS